MTMTHEQAALQAATDGVVDLIDVGAGSEGTLELLNIDDSGTATVITVLSSHTLSNPAFGAAAASGIATADTIADDTSANADGTCNGWRLKDADGDVVVTGEAGKKYAIGGVSTGSNTITITGGDYTTTFAAGKTVNIIGSTGNDGRYVISSVEYTGGNTVITLCLNGVISDATVDGYIHRGELGLDNDSIATGQLVSITSFTYKATLT